jgi:hypothetical protein
VRVRAPNDVAGAAFGLRSGRQPASAPAAGGSPGRGTIASYERAQGDHSA